MSGVRRFEHAVLRVTDRDAAVAFYTDVLGLVEMERENGTVYLGCGLDENYDVGLTDGGTGLEHFAIRVESADELARYESRLQAADIDTERVDGAEPNQVDGVRFTLPTGIDMELVTVADRRYHHPTDAIEGRSPAAPRDADHVNLMSWDVERDLEILVDPLEFAISDEIVGGTGFTMQAWTRSGELHHDVALSTADNVAYTLHHLSFEVDSVEHMKTICDRVAQAGHRLELGLNRHNAGANDFVYLWTPGGNRIELTAEMATVDAGAETTVREIDRTTNTVSSWGGVEPTPEFLEKGS